MNDRGLRLTLPEMLRGYLLSRIESPAGRSTASDIWKERVADLAELGKEEDVDAIQAWLRGRRAETTSRYVAGVAPGDYERIGNEFHRWVRDVEETRLGLITPSDFGDFIHKDFDFYVGWYARLRRAAESHTESLETVQYIASQGFTLHYAIFLAALHTGDNEHTVYARFARLPPTSTSSSIGGSGTACGLARPIFAFHSLTWQSEFAERRPSRSWCRS